MNPDHDTRRKCDDNPCKSMKLIPDDQKKMKLFSNWLKTRAIKNMTEQDNTRRIDNRFTHKESNKL